jgi:hypothetical protein
VADSSGPMACAVCARVLDRVGSFDSDEAEAGVAWAHLLSGAPADHLAVPVPVDQVQVLYRCDFCSVDGPEWTVPAASFAVDGIPAGSIAGWAACDVCAALVGRNEWSALRRRVLARYLPHGLMGDAAEESMGRTLDRTWRQLRANITGPPIRRRGAAGGDPHGAAPLAE